MPLAKTIVSLLHPIEGRPLPIKPRLRKLAGTRAVIFSVYGTLFMTQTSKGSTVQPAIGDGAIIVEALEESDFDIFERDVDFGELYAEHLQAHYDIRSSEGIEYPEINICDVWQDFLNELFARDFIDGDLTERSVRRVIVHYECRVNPVWPAKDSLELIRKLQDRNLLAGTIATAQFYTPVAMEALYQNSLETLGFREPLCIWSYEHRHRKPSPIVFNLCEAGLRTFGLRPSEVLYVGNDVVVDMAPANAIGFKTALFVGDANSARPGNGETDDPAARPTVIFNEFGQLMDCIF
jgi:putative hydrolase of the HAD superfamily